MLGSPMSMSGASIWGLGRRTPSISRSPDASMRRSSCWIGAWRPPAANSALLSRTPVIHSIDCSDAAEAPKSGRTGAATVPRSGVFSTRFWQPLSVEMVGSREAVYMFMHIRKDESTGGSLSSIDDSDVAGGAGRARRQGARARRIGRGGSAACGRGLRTGHPGGGGGAPGSRRHVQRTSSGNPADCRRVSQKGSRDLSLSVEAPPGNPPWERDRGGVSLYGDAIRALRQVILLDERVRNSSADLARMASEIADLRDRGTRLQGMLAASMAGARQAAPARDRRRLPSPPDQTGG